MDADYTRQSVEALTEAIRLGFKTRFLIQVDPDLAPVRTRPDFQDLLQQLPQRENEPCPAESLPAFLTVEVPAN